MWGGGAALGGMWEGLGRGRCPPVLDDLGCLLLKHLEGSPDPRAILATLTTPDGLHLLRPQKPPTALIHRE